MLILGIETSCDDTSAAIVKDGRKVLSNVVSSQDRFHSKYGGVVPEIASRKHLEIVNFVVSDALDSAGCGFSDIDAVAVTQGPGLVGSLLIGIMTAKTIAYVNKIPLLGINHIEGHIFSNLLERSELKPPFLSLVVSGGHSELIWVKDYGKYEVLGRTRDDAAGEVYDKVAKYFGLGYPGGPVIDRLAKNGRPDAVRFPRAKLKDGSLDFSFSGIKTAVINHGRSIDAELRNKELKQKKGKFAKIQGLDEKTMADILASFQKTVVDMLMENTLIAARRKQAGTIVIGGGVASNTWLRKKFSEAAESKSIRVFYPGKGFSTDNAAMIACAGYYGLRDGKKGSPMSLTATANMSVVD